jgi:hypothetical protein
MGGDNSASSNAAHSPAMSPARGRVIESAIAASAARRASSPLSGRQLHR